MNNSGIWIKESTCAKPHMVPEWWDLVGNRLSKDNKLAVGLCSTCPIRDECFADAEQHPELSHGTIRGGVPRFTKPTFRN